MTWSVLDAKDGAGFPVNEAARFFAGGAGFPGGGTISSSRMVLTDAPAWLAASKAVGDGKNILLRNGDVCWPFCIRKRFGLTILESTGQNTRSVAGPLMLHTVESAWDEGSSAFGADYSTERKAFPTLMATDLPGLPERVDLIDLRRIPRECLGSLFPGATGRMERVDALWFNRGLGATADEFLHSLAPTTRKEYVYSTNRVRRTFGGGASVTKKFV